QFPRWLPWIDADYGSAAYLPLVDGGKYTATLSAAGGLIARPADAATAEKLQASGWGALLRGGQHARGLFVEHRFVRPGADKHDPASAILHLVVLDAIGHIAPLAARRIRDVARIRLRIEFLLQRGIGQDGVAFRALRRRVLAFVGLDQTARYQ